ncbi:HlyD family secretion protein [Salinisphaera aquimarina]|uniref:HlyD family secretion protein n=1 Tax=Salinisphaera aquimarina TaxID=2094031 RepID=A0ABV7ES03_9GAMM
MTQSDSAADPAPLDLDANAADNAATPQKSGKGKRVAIIAVCIAVVCVVAALLYWWLTRNQESTDDAFVQADIVQVAPRVTGTAIQVFVRDNQHVEKGDPLFTLDPADFLAELASAEANLQAAQASYDSSQRQLSVTRQTSGADIDSARAAVETARAEYNRAAADARRYQALYAKREVSRQQLDQANTTATSARARISQAQAQLAQAQSAPDQIALKQSQGSTAKARVAQARAQLDRARLNLSYTDVRAPQSGKIAQKSVLVGSHMNAGQAALAIVADDPWVVANFKETQLTRMRIGQPVSIEVDAFPDHDFTGRVESIQSGTGVTFSLLPPQNATGNFVKIVQRVPVKIVFDHPDAVDKIGLAPGMSVLPTVNVAAAAKPLDRPHPATARTNATAAATTPGQ